eukprot:m.878198 g.878198  ORF g.878198 m.878198 type:complete len:157 (+) comp23585_c0_seq24:1029-1499(+)
MVVCMGAGACRMLRPRCHSREITTTTHASSCGRASLAQRNGQVVADDSLLCVYDNYGAAGTADKAMPKIKSGGSFVFLPGKGGALSKHPKAGVSQYSLWTDDSDHKDLDAIAAFVDQGKMVTLVSSVYSLADVPKAFASEYAGKTLGKIAIAVSPQ